MKRNLLTQIRNEWRDNIWMVLELTVVTGVIWILATNFYMVVKDYFSPRGYEYENVFTFNTKSVDKDSPHFVKTAGEESSKAVDLHTLVSRLRENPHVKEVALGKNALPYYYSFQGGYIYLMDEPDSLGYFGNFRHASEGVATTLGLKSLTGKSRAQLDEMLQKGEVLISNNSIYEENGRKVSDLIGRRIILYKDSSRLYRVGDIIQAIRRNDYEPSWGGTVLVPITKEEFLGDVIVKLHEGHEQRFKEDVKNNPELRKQRNVYLSNLRKLSDIRESCQRDMETQKNILIFMLLFLLLTIFLGLLGTFWFRMQQRTGEIALRKVCGATRSDIFRRVIGEGMILMVIAVAIVSAIMWPFSGKLTNWLGCSRVELLLFEGVASAIVSLGIVVSLWYPAKRAMKINPASALKSE